MPDPKTTPEREFRRTRTWLLSLAGLAFVGLAAILAIVLAVDLGWQRDRLIEYGKSIAEESLGIEIAIDDTTGRLSRGIVLRGVRLGDSAEPFLEFEALQIDWNWRSLISSETQVIQSIRLDGWAFRLHRTSEGKWLEVEDLIARLATNEDEAGPPGTSPPGPKLLIRKIEIGVGELSLLLDPPKPSSSPLGARLHIEGEIRDLRLTPNASPSIENAALDAKLVESDSGIPDFDREVEANLSLRAVGRRIKSLIARVDAPGIRAQLRGKGLIENLDECIVTVVAEDLAPLSGWVQTSAPLSGQVDGRADLSGPIDGLVGKIHLEARNVAFDEMRAAELVVDLDLPESLTEAFANPMQATAGLNLRARRFDPGPFEVDWLPSGEADLDVDGEIAAGRLNLRQGKLRLAGLALEATGSLNRERIDELNLQLTAEDVGIWVERWRPGLALRGPLRGSASLAGPLRNPRGRLALQSDGLSLQERPVEPLEVTLERGQSGPALLEILIGSALERSLELTARIEVERERVEFEAAAEAETLTALFAPETVMRGRFVTRGFFEADPKGPIFDVSFDSDEMLVDTYAVGRVELVAASMDGERIDVSTLSADGDLGTIALSRPAAIQIARNGEWTLEEAAFRVDPVDPPADSSEPGAIEVRARGIGSDPASVDVSVANLSVVDVNRFLEDQEPLGGRLNGDLTWRRARKAGWTRGDLEWTDASLGEVTLDRVTAHWTGEPESIDVEIGTIVAARSPLSIRGRIGLPEPDAALATLLAVDRLSLHAKLDDFDLSVLEALSPKWMRRMTGRASGSIHVEPSPAGPNLSGQARITNAGLTVPLLRQRFAPIDGVFILANRNLAIDQFRIGRLGQGATLNGALRLTKNGPTEIDGRIRFDHFPLSRSPAAWIDVIGDVGFEGTLERPVIRGVLSIDDTKIGVPAEDDPIMKEIRIATRDSNGDLSEAAGTVQDPLHNADIDIVFKIPDSTRLRGQGANLFIEGEAQADKRPANPLRIKGEARVVNGTYTFQGRSFEVRRGRVLLTGDERLDPVLDVEARHRVSDITAIIELTGRLSSPVVRLTSDPPRSEQDVLAYLLFGRPADEVSAAGNSGFGAAATRLFAGVAERELRDLLGDAMPVDSIEIGADAEGNTSELGFGKYLSPNLFFRYVHVLGDEPTDRVGVEYRLNDSVSVGSSVSTTGDAGLDLIYRKDF